MEQQHRVHPHPHHLVPALDLLRRFGHWLPGQPEDGNLEDEQAKGWLQAERQALQSQVEVREERGRGLGLGHGHQQQAWAVEQVLLWIAACFAIEGQCGAFRGQCLRPPPLTVGAVSQ